MAYNDDQDKLYCITPTNSLKIYSGTDESLITELSPPMDYKYAFHNLIYESNHDKMFWAINYGAGHSNSNIIKVIDGQTNVIEAEYTFTSMESAINDILINPNDPEIIFISSYKELITLSYNYVSKTFSYLNTYTFPDNTMPGKLVYNSNNNKLYVNKHAHNELLVFDGLTGAYDHVINVPFNRVYKTDFNPVNNKLYFTGLDNDLQINAFYMFSCNEEHTTPNYFNCNGVLYNPEENVVYVSNFYYNSYSDPVLKMFDGETESEIKSVVNNGGAGSVMMYYNPASERLIVGNNDGDYVFVGCSDQIDVIDASSGSVISSISISGNVIDFEFYGNHIYALTSGNKSLISININDFSIDAQIHLYQTPKELKVFDNKLYCIKFNSWSNYSTINIFDLEDNLNLLQTYPLPINITKIQASDFSGNKYFMGFNAVEGRYKIRILDENDVLSGDEIYIPNGYMLDMLYNNINNRLYVFFEKTGLNDNYKSLYLNMYNSGDNSYLSTVDLQQNGANTGLQNNIGHNVANSQNILPGEKLLVFNNNQDNMYVLNGNFSNINVIECTPEQAVYHSGYNWISFPRLDRTNNKDRKSVV